MKTNEALDFFELDARLFYDAVAFSTEDYLYVIDMRRDLALLSDNMREDFGFDDSLILGLIPAWRERIVERDRKRFDESIEDMLSGKTDVHDIEYQILNAKGERIWILCRGLLKRDAHGEPTVFAGVVTNLERKGRIDPITGLFTHDECLKLIDRLIAHGGSGGVMVLGLDDFSRINSLNDHAFGDGVLRQFAQTAQRVLPDDASMFRLDGDVFAAVVDGAGRRAMEDAYRSLHMVSNRPHAIDGTPYFCTASAGIAMIGEDGRTGQDLLKNAESALEESKHRGKNTFAFFSSAMTHEKRRRLEISDLMQLSVVDGMEHFSLHYQPLVDARTLELAGAEALLRWESPERGSISPVEFIPILESYGLIGQVGAWVLEEAVRQCAAWSARRPGFIVNVNISYLQLLDEGFVPLVRELLERYGTDPRSIVLEMTESYFVTDMEALRSTFGELRGLGVRIAMDDFGTGYSSLGLLSQSPADIVKIDRLFIRNIHEEDFNRSFIDAVIELCHSVGIEVTVEGVEQATELDAVRSIGADCIQGFIVSRPVPAKRFEELFLTPQAS
ncbi:putative bifunctional diguanylate cyclase/phosphodiesterase [Arabiibacter massiliensis]|uniref:putative bifunctional diguanylate cyclase/phosphodiesterase n=1 Tax=Arabiibacter massiliensis TaxID=1870985 RepID=UPI0009BB0DA1|nr:GGDEF and EAL domain-containing protein [Arabiibacter massiliensis]